MAVTIGRRELLAALGSTAAAWPLAARAQARRPLVGYLAGAASASVMRGTTKPAFINGLREQGYVEGTLPTSSPTDFSTGCRHWPNY